MDDPLIKSASCLEQGCTWLIKHEPAFSDAIEQFQPLDLRLRPDGFEALLRAIVGQQVSVAAAAAIWKRLEAAGYITQESLIKASDEDLRACGLSRPKLRYARALCDTNLDYEALRSSATSEVITTLTAISGIGVWTAEIYAMFNLARADAFPAGDLALKEAARLLFNLESRPTEGQLRKMAENWAPWRSVAARLLWCVYANEKRREGVNT